MTVLEGIYVAATKRQPMKAVESVDVTPAGLAGDRYAVGAGTFSKPVEEGDAGKHVTLIAAEAIEAALAEHGDDFGDGRHRRNLVVRGIGDLNELIYAHLRIGRDCVLRVDRTCPPCRHLDTLTGLASMTSLNSRGGLRLSVVEPGTIRVGDAVEVTRRSRH